VSSDAQHSFDDCIYCGEPSGSGEHTVAASVGGLRTDKGIQCGTCNRGFSPIDESLSSDLRLLNAQIGVQNSRTKKLVEAIVTEPQTGRTYILSDGGELRHPEAVVLRDVTVGDVRTVEAVASNQKQADDFVHRMKLQGKPTKTYRTRAPHLLVEQPQAFAGFSGPPSFRAVAKTVLNLLAQWRPAAARHCGLKPLKDFVRFGTDNAFAHFEYDADPDKRLPPDSFDFQHRFLIAFDARKKVAYAKVSLFGVYEICIRLGNGDWGRSETYVYDMDVLAVRSPGDIKTHEFDGALFPPGTKTNDPRPAFQQRVDRFLAKFVDKQWTEEAPSLAERLDAIRSAPAVDRHDLIVTVLEGQRQRLLDLANTFITRLAAHLKKTLGDEGEAVGELLQLLVSGDTTTQTGVSELSFVNAEMLRNVMADAILPIVNSGPVDKSTLRNLLEGQPGIVVVGSYLTEAVVKPVLRALNS